MKIAVYWLNFHWKMSLYVQLILSPSWFTHSCVKIHFFLQWTSESHILLLQWIVIGLGNNLLPRRITINADVLELYWITSAGFESNKIIFGKHEIVLSSMQPNLAPRVINHNASNHNFNIYAFRLLPFLPLWGQCPMVLDAVHRIFLLLRQWMWYFFRVRHNKEGSDNMYVLTWWYIITVCKGVY